MPKITELRSSGLAEGREDIAILPYLGFGSSLCVETPGMDLWGEGGLGT